MNRGKEAVDRGREAFDRTRETVASTAENYADTFPKSRIRAPDAYHTRRQADPSRATRRRRAPALRARGRALDRTTVAGNPPPCPSRRRPDVANRRWRSSCCRRRRAGGALLQPLARRPRPDRRARQLRPESDRREPDAVAPAACRWRRCWSSLGVLAERRHARLRVVRRGDRPRCAACRPRPSGCARSSSAPWDRGRASCSELQSAADAVAKAAEGGTARRRAGEPMPVEIVEPAIDVKQYSGWDGRACSRSPGRRCSIVFLSFFMLSSGDLYRRKFVRLAGARLSNRRVTVEILDEVGPQMSIVPDPPGDHGHAGRRGDVAGVLVAGRRVRRACGAWPPAS